MKRIAGALARTIALAAIGAGGYLVGHGTRAQPSKPDPGALATARYDGYNDGYATGRQTGEQVGQSRGDAAAQQANGLLRQTASRSFDAGAKAIFDGFGSPWTTDSYYIVKIVAGSTIAPYEISSRLPMDSSDYYDLCPSTGGICGGTLADITSSPGTGSGSGGSQTPNTVPLPPTSGVPGLGNRGPTYPVVCKDGTLSYSGGHSGACSHHGGEF